MANIIIPKKNNLIGKTRSEQEENMRKEWGGTMDDGQLDRLKYAERKMRDKLGSKHNFLRGNDIDRVK